MGRMKDGNENCNEDELARRRNLPNETEEYCVKRSTCLCFTLQRAYH